MGFRETQKRIQDLLAAEKGGGRKPFGQGHTFGMIYPNSYYLGMSNLGHQLVWRVINDDPNWVCERLYCDFDPLMSMENQQPPSAFDVLAFSVAFELDYLNVVDFIVRAGFPLEAQERGPEYPLIVGAGVCIDVNRLPIYDFVDLFMNGEGEEMISVFLRAFEEHGHDRRHLLEHLAGLPGFEVTAGARRRYGLDMPVIEDFTPPRLPRVTVHELNRFMNCSHFVTPNTEFSSMCLVEVARGCPYRCTFCYVGHNLNPYRVTPLERVKQWIDMRREWTDRFGFVASAVASHPNIDDLCLYCDEIGVKVSYSSVRAEDITPVMIRSLARSGTQTLTIAPEAGSFRLRRLLGKARLTDERILWVVEEGVKAGIPNLKMYFMIGLPTETEEDIRAIPELIRKVQKVFVDASRARGRIGTIGLNVGIFVPKPNTPLERFSPMPIRQARKHSGLLQKELNRLNNVKYQAPSTSAAQVQALLSKGDLRTGQFLKAVHASGGDWKQGLREWRETGAPIPALA